MTTIQIEIPDTLAEKLKPHQERLVELLELGLRQWQAGQPQSKAKHEQLLQVLAASGRVTIPQPYSPEIRYDNREPVATTGVPASEIIREQRGPL